MDSGSKGSACHLCVLLLPHSLGSGLFCILGCLISPTHTHTNLSLQTRLLLLLSPSPTSICTMLLSSSRAQVSACRSAGTTRSCRPRTAAVIRASAGDNGSGLAEGTKVKVTAEVKVFHAPKQPNGIDLAGKEGVIVKNVANYKDKQLSPNLPYKVQFQLEAEGAPAKFFAHLVSAVVGRQAEQTLRREWGVSMDAAAHTSGHALTAASGPALHSNTCMHTRLMTTAAESARVVC